MDPAILVLVMLAGVSHAAETKCKASQNMSLCSANLGGSVSIQVMNNASGHRLWCKRQFPTGSITVFNLKKERVTIHDSLKNRTEFFINNGTLKITHVERNDSGVYNVEIFRHNGVLLRNVNFELVVQGKCLSSSLFML
ncbi:T-cell surface antigen CD2 [Dissostichus eleginoides]|uniref:T-cell surface antigen CD2 n=1 Tax=Dissostichus eleginoides TaxID=100907 RepID=A0AAD9CMF3_DISEL|nr:T-cell surface antigen CD2 [Dissostichus eleginoides]